MGAGFSKPTAKSSVFAAGQRGANSAGVRFGLRWATGMAMPDRVDTRRLAERRSPLELTERY